MIFALTMALALIGSSLASNGFSNPVWNPAALTECYKCSEFNSQGVGFVAYPSYTECCKYYMCWKGTDLNYLQGAEMTCPEGTWFNPGVGGNGAPCTANKPYPQCVDVCPAPNPPVWMPPCHLYPHYYYPENFGIISGGVFVQTGTCPPGQVFDNAACTCIGSSTPCFCMMNLKLQSDIEDYSCHNGDTFPSGNAVSFGFDPDFQDFVGTFSNSMVTDNLFTGLYAGCWVNKLSVGFLMKAYNPSSPTMQGAVCYSSCKSFDPAQPSFCITVGQNKVVAAIGPYTAEWGPIVPNLPYYVAFVYNRNGGVDNLKLFVYDFPGFFACLAGNCPWKDATTTNGECIEPRPCGLNVGFTGSSADTNEYFDGKLSDVQVFHGINIFACSPFVMKP